MTISGNFHSLRPTLLGLTAVAALSLSACGGGGSSSDDNGSAIGGGDSPSLTTGTVAVLMTDAPTDAFCHIYATVESIDLLGTSGTPTNVFVGSETVDLLAMRNYTDFFAIDTAVPIGSYEKVRLTLSDLALVECDPVTGLPEAEAGWEHPHLPGNGKMDLNPRGMFEVIGGETLIIELDMDMNKSLHVHQTGNGRWQFRPVIFVTIRPDDMKLVRVYGRVGNLGDNAFNLCPIEPVSSTDDDDAVAGTECIEVFDLGNASIFNETGTPVGPGFIANDDLLTATGFLGLHDDSDGDSRMDDLRLDPVVIEIGPLGTFQRIRGAVVSALGNNDVFEFDGAPLDLGAGVFDVLFQRDVVEGYESTRIYALGSNQPLTLAALQPGTEGEVSGVFTDPLTSGEPLKSSLIVLDQDTTPDVAILDATIDTIAEIVDGDPATNRLTVDAGTLVDQCVKTDAATRYLLITESATSSETTEITFADLASGNSVDVYGAADPAEPTTCVLADTIQKYVPAP